MTNLSVILSVSFRFNFFYFTEENTRINSDTIETFREKIKKNIYNIYVYIIVRSCNDTVRYRISLSGEFVRRAPRVTELRARSFTSSHETRERGGEKNFPRIPPVYETPTFRSCSLSHLNNNNDDDAARHRRRQQRRRETTIKTERGNDGRGRAGRERGKMEFSKFPRGT